MLKKLLLLSFLFFSLFAPSKTYALTPSQDQVTQTTVRAFIITPGIADSLPTYVGWLVHISNTENKSAVLSDLEQQGSLITMHINTRNESSYASALYEYDHVDLGVLPAGNYTLQTILTHNNQSYTSAPVQLTINSKNTLSPADIYENFSWHQNAQEQVDSAYAITTLQEQLQNHPDDWFASLAYFVLEKNKSSYQDFMYSLPAGAQNPYSTANALRENTYFPKNSFVNRFQKENCMIVDDYLLDIHDLEAPTRDYFVCLQDNKAIFQNDFSDLDLFYMDDSISIDDTVMNVTKRKYEGTGEITARTHYTYQLNNKKPTLIQKQHMPSFSTILYYGIIAFGLLFVAAIVAAVIYIFSKIKARLSKSNKPKR